MTACSLLSTGLAVSLLGLYAPSSTGVRECLPPSTTPDSALLAGLQRGGLVVVFRHTHTDRSREEDDNFTVSNRASQRNLSARGEEEARLVGRRFTERAIIVSEVFASPMFRTRETAELAFGNTTLTESLRIRGGTPEALALLTTPPTTGTVRVLVTHNGFLQRHFGAAGHGQIGEGDAVVVEPLGTSFRVLGRIKLADWTDQTAKGGSDRHYPWSP